MHSPTHIQLGITHVLTLGGMLLHMMGVAAGDDEDSSDEEWDDLEWSSVAGVSLSNVKRVSFSLIRLSLCLRGEWMSGGGVKRRDPVLGDTFTRMVVSADDIPGKPYLECMD
jgi:hypothetical protein